MMKRIYVLGYIVALAMIWAFAAGCGQGKTKDGKRDSIAAVKQTYTCPMHPQVVQQQPGTCPICGMDLVPFDKNSTDATLTLGKEQILLANITTKLVGDTVFSTGKELNGRLVADPSGSAAIAARMAGRIENLYVKETGVPVQKGQLLYRIYSEQLLSLQQEYLLAYAQAKNFPDDRRFQQIAQAARQKLLLYGQPETKLQQLLQQQRTDAYITYTAPVTGIVATLQVTEGQYVEEGTNLMQLEDYSHLWVEADLYPGETAVKDGATVTVKVAGWENEPQQMVVRFVNPVMQDGTQLVQLRGTIANKNKRWQPGLQATLWVPSAATATSEKVLSLPVDAVIHDGNGTHIWVETEAGKFEPRSVVTGEENASSVSIKEGVQEGDRVVVTGAYLLYSEYVLKRGKHPIATHQH
ncbi:efflux RND transporter periplasmic adaptor subunit [Filimonas effusa]|uniref:Efflux RND transporter periplasmic adaptor subunit n=1 Tax=Filimonas effusa TaxID=2508721 RepID=A0A4Q1D9U3_9BACT|nr:efflux RND transporter periplasmic adaptor subunit [Filimonas effusa]RXK85648.1 efflux RND transporter periplasmic adaptor subunit [Filimonas effusa]